MLRDGLLRVVIVAARLRDPQRVSALCVVSREPTDLVRGEGVHVRGWEFDDIKIDARLDGFDQCWADREDGTDVICMEPSEPHCTSEGFEDQFVAMRRDELVDDHLGAYVADAKVAGVPWAVGEARVSEA